MGKEELSQVVSRRIDGLDARSWLSAGYVRVIEAVIAFCVSLGYIIALNGENSTCGAGCWIVIFTGVGLGTR
jgi:hypothetical protein